MMHRMRGLLLWLGGVGLTSGSVGCSQGHADLDAWVTAQRRGAASKLTVLHEPMPYEPTSYDGGQTRDPFDRGRLLRVLDRATERTQGASLLSMELKRRKDPLESFPLDAMAMVGTMNNVGRRVALVRVGGLIYQVRVGEHLGQHFGLVTSITESEVVLREVAQDGSGDWGERRAVLQLQTGEKNG